MPKRLLCVAREQLEWREYEDEPLQGTQVRIRTQYAAAKHGTEMAGYKGYAQERGVYDPEYMLFRQSEEPRERRPTGVGNMVVGPVVEVGPMVRELEVGDVVCAYSGFAETRTVDQSRCWKMPQGMSWKSAVCLDPADFAMGAVRDGHVRVGDAVAVFGLGAIGLMVVQIARLSGAYPVIAVDPIARRREIAADLGADLTLDPSSVDAGFEIKAATSRRGVDVAIDYSGSAAAMQAALRGVAYGGTVVAGASPPPYSAGLDFGMEAHINIPKIVFSRACSQPDREYPRWDEQRIFGTCWRLLSEGRITGEPIVQPVVPFGALLSEYPKIATQPAEYIKLGAEV
jgi:threonine dehydrogenase-like Zn-dependent dehydrogenase